MLFWRDHIASAVWSVFERSEGFYVINDESSNGKFVVFHTLRVRECFVGKKFHYSWECTCCNRVWLVPVVLLQMCSG